MVSRLALSVSSESYTPASDASSRHLSARLDQAIAYQHAGETPRATSLFDEIMASGETPADCAEAARHQATIKLHQGDWQEATRCITIAREAAALVADHDLMGEVLNIEAAILHAQGRHADAIARYERITAGPYGPRVRGLAHQNIGTCHGRDQQWKEAETHYQASLDCFRICDYVRGVCHALNNLGRLRFLQGDIASARRYLGEGIALAVSDGQCDLAALATLNRAEVHLADGNYDDASYDAACAMGFFDTATDNLHLTDCYRVMGDIARARGDAEGARAFYMKGHGVAASVGAQHEASVLRARIDALESVAA